MGGGASAANSPDQLKIKGDTAFRLNDYSEAIYWYTAAISSIAEATSVNPTRNDYLGTLLSNRAAAYDSSGYHERSLADATQVIDLRPRWSKGYYRAARACLGLNAYTRAISYIDMALALEPDEASNSSLMKLKEKVLEDMSSHETAKSSSKASRLNHRQALTYTYSWGMGDGGQLGLGTPLESKVSPTGIDAFRGKHIVAVACGALHTVAISTEGQTYSWGNNDHMQLGYRIGANAVTNDNVPTQSRVNSEFSNLCPVPQLIPALVGIQVVAVAAGAGHSIAVTSTGDVYAWGIGKQGQLGLGVTENVAEPRLVEALRGQQVVAACCGIAHTVFLLDNGSILTCGLNNYGQLGLGSRSSSSPSGVLVTVDSSKGRSYRQDVTVPTLVEVTTTEFKVSVVSCGGAHTLLVDTDGRVWSAGSNSCGQLGRSTGAESSSDVFERVHITASESMNTMTDSRVISESKTDNDNTVSDNIRESSSERASLSMSQSMLQSRSRVCAFAACGEEFSAVITRDKSVFTWGLGIAGQIGNGTTNCYTAPQLVAGVEGQGVESLTCSQGQVLAVTSTGVVWTWGLPGYRADLGDPEMILKPEKVAAFGKRKKIHQLSCGRKHYVLLTAGTYGPNCYIKKGFGARALTPISMSISEKAKRDRENSRYGTDANSTGEGGESKSSGGIGINDYDKGMEVVVAGKKISFVIQGVDLHGDVCEHGGVQFEGIIEHELLDYEITFRKQMKGVRKMLIDADGAMSSKLTQSGKTMSSVPSELPVILLDDNMDGTYDGCTTLYLSGEYRLSLSLDGLAISGSPFNVKIQPGPICAPCCIVWWSRLQSQSTKYAVRTSDTDVEDQQKSSSDTAPISASASAPATALAAALTSVADGKVNLEYKIGETIVFTVSCRDKFGNKCTEDTDLVGYSIVVSIAPVTRNAHMNGSEKATAEEEEKVIKSEIAASKYEWHEHTRGVFPCALPVPEQIGEYRISAQLANSNGRGADAMRLISDDALLTVRENVMTNKFISSEASINNEGVDQKGETDGKNEEESEAVNALSKLEMTRKRARDALLRQQAQLTKEREDQRRKKAVKRTGGGFIVQYSKDI